MGPVLTITKGQPGPRAGLGPGLEPALEANFGPVCSSGPPRAGRVPQLTSCHDYQFSPSPNPLDNCLFLVVTRERDISSKMLF